jgi:ABC-type multidrug transport system ATPase subunit
MPSSDAAGGPALLDARGLRRSFGGLRVLRGVDLTVHPGEAVIVAGPNGAGKTTLLRLLAGLLRPEAGEVLVLGRPVRGGGEAGRRAVGFVSHQSLLYDDLTLAQNFDIWIVSGHSKKCFRMHVSAEGRSFSHRLALVGLNQPAIFAIEPKAFAHLERA